MTSYIAVCLLSCSGCSGMSKSIFVFHSPSWCSPARTGWGACLALLPPGACRQTKYREPSRCWTRWLELTRTVSSRSVSWSLPPPRGPGWGSAASPQRRWSGAQGSAPGSSTASRSAAACGTLRRILEYSRPPCGRACQARGWPGTAATSGWPHRPQRSQGWRGGGWWSGRHQSILLHFQIAWSILVSKCVD